MIRRLRAFLHRVWLEIALLLPATESQRQAQVQQLLKQEAWR